MLDVIDCICVMLVYSLNACVADVQDSTIPHQTSGVTLPSVPAVIHCTGSQCTLLPNCAAVHHVWVAALLGRLLIAFL